MRLQDTLDRYRKASVIFKEIVESGSLTLDGNGFRISRMPGLSEQATLTLLRLQHRSADVIETYSYGKLMVEGAKIFRPTQEQLEMLEQIHINIPISDYVQPYPTLTVEFPEGYFSKKKVHCPQAGEWYYGERVAVTHEPAYVIVRHDAAYIFATIAFTSGLSIKVALRHKEDEEIETIIEMFTDSDTFRNSLEVSVDEWVVAKSCVRSVLNYCLLLDEVGCRPVPTVQDKRRKVNRAERRAKMFNPVLWELSQDVKLYRTVAAASDLPSEATGITMPPHHRRGHYRQQRYGTGLALKKRIRIPPVFVNSHLFFGRPSDATATYHG